MRRAAQETEATILDTLPRGFSLVGGVRLVMSFDDPERDQWHAEIMLRRPRKFNSWTLSGPLADTASGALDALVSDVENRVAGDKKGGFL